MQCTLLIHCGFIEGTSSYFIEAYFISCLFLLLFRCACGYKLKFWLLSKTVLSIIDKFENFFQ